MQAKKIQKKALPDLLHKHGRFTAQDRAVLNEVLCRARMEAENACFVREHLLEIQEQLVDVLKQLGTPSSGEVTQAMIDSWTKKLEDRAAKSKALIEDSINATASHKVK